MDSDLHVSTLRVYPQSNVSAWCRFKDLLRLYSIKCPDINNDIPYTLLHSLRVLVICSASPTAAGVLGNCDLGQRDQRVGPKDKH